MSYRIHYPLIIRSNYIGKRSIFTLLCFFLLLVLVFCLWPEGKDVIKDGLAFLQSTVMVSGLNEMAEGFQNGLHISDVIEKLYCDLIQGKTFVAN